MTQALEAALAARADGCFLCKWIAEDLAKHGRLTDNHPPQGKIEMDLLFPVGAKEAHLKLEGIPIPRTNSS